MDQKNTALFRDKRILVVDDHRNIRATLRITLESEGASVDEADTHKEALAKLATITLPVPTLPYDAVLLDIRLPDGNGLDILKRISDAGFATKAIMISGEGTASDAFQATQMGAFDYVEKPFVPERIIVSVRRCLDFNRIRLANVDLTRQINRGREIIGNHPKVLELLAVIKRVAPTNGRVLIVGESGTGKELVAKAIHRESERADKPLVKVNCAAIPATLIEPELFGHEKGAFTGAIRARKGYFEQANGGTIFLDEIGELSADVQAKLLRVLQSGEMVRVGGEETIQVDVRLISATHRDLPEMVQNGEFREDLYYRLNVVTLQVPALRDRPSDIGPLAQHFLELACEEHSVGHRVLGETALRQLEGHSWPGNIRELRNLIERSAILSEEEVIDHIDELNKTLHPDRQSAVAPPVLEVAPASADGRFQFGSDTIPWQEFHQAVDQAYVKHILCRTEGNVSEAARILCLERAYLHRLMRKLGIHRDVVINEEK